MDISHESLIRQWDRLRTWVDEETQNRDHYVHIRDDAKRWEGGVGSLWDGPQLVQARAWWDKRRPTAAWSRRYGDGFKAADTFLRESERRRDLEKWREQEEQRKEQERVKLESEHALTRRTLAGPPRPRSSRRAWPRSPSGNGSGRRRSPGERSRASRRRCPSPCSGPIPSRACAAPSRRWRRRRRATSAGALREALAVAVVRKLWSVPLARASAVAFSPDGRRLAGASATREEPGRVGIWEVGTGRRQASLCNQDVAALRWTPDGRGVLLVLNDGSLVLWRVGGEAEAATTLVSAPGVEQVEDVELRPDGEELAMAAGDKGLLRFDLDLVAAQPSARLRSSPAAQPDAIASVAYSPDGRLLAVGGSRRTVALIDTATGQRVCETKPLGRGHPARRLQRAPARAAGGEQLRPHRPELAGRRLPGRADAPHRPSRDRHRPGFHRRRQLPRVGEPRQHDQALGPSRGRRGVLPADDAIRVGPDRRLQLQPGGDRSAAGRTLGPIPPTHIATVGVDQDEDDPTRETLSLWDVAPRTKADILRGLTGAQAYELARLPGLMTLARELQVDPKVQEDQVPGCR